MRIARRFLPLACLLCSLCCFVPSARAAFTIRQVLEAPFAYALTAAPGGTRVAWVLNEQGRRNIYFAEAPGWQGRKLTSFNDDDGQDIDQLSWMPDGSALFFARGGDFEMQRGNPNPAVSPLMPTQSVWVVRLDGSTPKPLLEGNSPAVSPRGDAVVFLHAGQLYRMDPDGSHAAAIVNDKGSFRELTWSPDGSQLAFVSNRVTHSLIGVYRFSDATLRYLDPSVDQDSSPAWSPDGTRLAFLRVPASSLAFAFGPMREAQPFSIRVADPATGAGHAVWQADAVQGSAFHEIEMPRQVLWAAGDYLVFPWEKSGWVQLYAVPAAGGSARPLTSGNNPVDSEVEHVALSAGRRTVYFSTNRNDIDRRHIWEVRVAPGSQPSPVTSGDGIEVSPAPLASGNLAYLGSSARYPAQAVVRRADGKIVELAPGAMPADFPEDQLVVPSQVIFSAADGMRIHAQLFLPPASAAGVKHPAIVFFHGGSRRQMLLGFHYMDYYSNAYALNQYFACHGYIVLSVNYRSGIGYGMKFREALNYGATGASEFNDVLGAGLYLRGRADVDPARIGLWGGSYGGYLTALGLARASSLFKAGVDMHGVHDWNKVIGNFVAAYDPQKQADAARLAFASSPLASVATWRSPVLLIQGDDDRNVPFEETIRLAEALRRQGVYFELLVIPDEIHMFLRHASWLKAYGAAADFFDRKLR